MQHSKMPQVQSSPADPARRGLAHHQIPTKTALSPCEGNLFLWGAVGPDAVPLDVCVCVFFLTTSSNLKFVLSWIPLHFSYPIHDCVSTARDSCDITSATTNITFLQGKENRVNTCGAIAGTFESDLIHNTHL